MAITGPQGKTTASKVTAVLKNNEICHFFSTLLQMLPIWDIPIERVVYLSTGVTTYCIMSQLPRLEPNGIRL